ncbi:unknown [Salmonella phage FelixO1]|uniref:Uncharacterized protein n=1 Tax=Salmonella phage Felix O1 (isolate Felix O1-VT1) TaxID=1283336 RepID=Q6KGC3_BPFO1|nr:unknown [Salmonella phage FelixO1]
MSISVFISLPKIRNVIITSVTINVVYHLSGFVTMFKPPNEVMNFYYDIFEFKYFVTVSISTSCNLPSFSLSIPVILVVEDPFVGVVNKIILVILKC